MVAQDGSHSISVVPPVVVPVVSPLVVAPPTPVVVVPPVTLVVTSPEVAPPVPELELELELELVAAVVLGEVVPVVGPALVPDVAPVVPEPVVVGPGVPVVDAEVVPVSRLVFEVPASSLHATHATRAKAKAMLFWNISVFRFNSLARSKYTPARLSAKCRQTAKARKRTQTSSKFKCPKLRSPIQRSQETF